MKKFDAFNESSKALKSNYTISLAEGRISAGGSLAGLEIIHLSPGSEAPHDVSGKGANCIIEETRSLSVVGDHEVRSGRSCSAFIEKTKDSSSRTGITVNRGCQSGAFCNEIKWIGDGGTLSELNLCHLSISLLLSTQG